MSRKWFSRGEIEEVARYCESDVLNTYRVWLVYELFRGSITAVEHDWSEAQARNFVASRKSANPHLSNGHSGGHPAFVLTPSERRLVQAMARATHVNGRNS